MSSKSEKRDINPALRAALGACKQHLTGVAVFSFFLNLLYLAPTIYMMQVYDRVVPTGGVVTLLYLTLILIFALVVLSRLDQLRTRLLMRSAARLDKLLSGEQLPEAAALCAWLFHTATGASLQPSPRDAPPWYLSEAEDRHVWLIYRPQLDFLKSPDAALTLTRAREFAEWGRTFDAARDRPPKGHLVFAPAKYLSNKQLREHGIDYAPLPYALYRES